MSTKPDLSKCRICKKLLNQKDDPTSGDCGGDCLQCMSEIGDDPDCKLQLRIKVFIHEYTELCKKHGLFYGALCIHDPDGVHEYPSLEPREATPDLIDNFIKYGCKNNGN